MVLGIGRQRLGNGARLAGADLLFHNQVSGREDGGTVGPAAAFGAGDRDAGLGLFAEQDGGVEHAILFCAREFLAVQEKDGFFGGVLHKQFGDSASLRGLSNANLSSGGGFTKRQVVGRMVQARDDGQDRDVAVSLRGAEGQGSQVLLQFSVHGARIPGSTGKCRRRDVRGRRRGTRV